MVFISKLVSGFICNENVVSLVSRSVGLVVCMQALHRGVFSSDCSGPEKKEVSYKP